MVPGGGKRKGSQFEREICTKLSLWVSKGERDDLFWRTSMSGGRATIRHQAGKTTKACGDICAVAGSHWLTEKFFIECKFVKSLDYPAFIFNRGGALVKFWETARKEAKKHKLWPLLIAKQNGYPSIILMENNQLPREFTKLTGIPRPIVRTDEVNIYLFDEVVKCTPL